jgi:hypothetical protein
LKARLTIYAWLSGVPLCATDDAILVNWFSIETLNAPKVLAGLVTGAGRMCVGIPAPQAKAAIAEPPTQQKSSADMTTPPRAVVMDNRFSFGNTASLVAP